MTQARDARRHSPAAERNGPAIEAALRHRLPDSGLILEVASGSGQHCVRLAHAFPHLRWQPSDIDPEALASIAAWQHAAAQAHPGTSGIHRTSSNDQTSNDGLCAPITLDVVQGPWPVHQAAAVLAVNLVHIAPWPTTPALLRNAASCLSGRGQLFIYGPFRRGGVHTSPSNATFDAWLRERDPAWGVRDLEAIVDCARPCGLHLEEAVPMPANNLLLVFTSGGTGPDGRFGGC